MGAQRAGWLAALKLEAAGRSKEHTAMSLLDLTKAFELVPHDVLIAAAVAYGYPLFLLRLTLAAYRLSRRVGLDGIYSEAYRATRGITAGSGCATT